MARMGSSCRENADRTCAFPFGGENLRSVCICVFFEWPIVMNLAVRVSSVSRYKP